MCPFVKVTTDPGEIAKISKECIEHKLYEPNFYGIKVFERMQYAIHAIAYIEKIGWAKIIDYDDGMIATVYVKPEYRRRRYGTYLFDKIKEFYGSIPGTGNPSYEGRQFFNKYFNEEKSDYSDANK
jgi:GNAT superfamily N-acetyltransferase